MPRKPTESPLIFVEATIATILGRNSSMTILTVAPGMWFTGEAKREPGDPADDSIAQELSLARALESAAQYYNRRASRAVIRNSGSITRTSQVVARSVPKATCQVCGLDFRLLSDGMLRPHKRQRLDGEVVACAGGGNQPKVSPLAEVRKQLQETAP